MNTPENKRFRIHLSTLLLLMLFSSIVCVLNFLPSSYLSFRIPQSFGQAKYEAYGRPFTAVVADGSAFPTDDMPVEESVFRTEAMLGIQIEPYFFFRGLGLNIALYLFLGICLMVGWELRIRRRLGFRLHSVTKGVVYALLVAFIVINAHFISSSPVSATDDPSMATYQLNYEYGWPVWSTFPAISCPPIYSNNNPLLMNLLTPFFAVAFILIAVDPFVHRLCSSEKLVHSQLQPC